MSEKGRNIPHKFAFSEFYEMLKEYVGNVEARKALEIYDNEYGAGRGYLTDGSQCSDLAFDSYGNFKLIGWNILAEHGWPTYENIIRSTSDDYESRKKIEDSGNAFINIARRLIRDEPHEKGWYFQDKKFDINDEDSVIFLLKRWNEKYPDIDLFSLSGGGR